MSNVGFANHDRTSRASSGRRSAKSAAIASASSAVGDAQPSGDELIERVGESDEVGLARASAAARTTPRAG